MNHKKLNWEVEVEYNLFKIYDSNNTLAGYFFPNIDSESTKDEEFERLVKSNSQVRGGSLLLPMVRVGIFDNDDGLEIDNTIAMLEQSIERIERWKKWIKDQGDLYHISGSFVYTAREDRNMLSILIDIDQTFVMGEKQLGTDLSLILNSLHEQNLL